MLIAGMGAGKTIIALTAMQELLRDGVLDRILVIAPLKVANTVWKQEAEKWSQTSDLKIGICTGKDRSTVLDSDAQVVVINFENIAWLCKTVGRINDFDGLLIDELSRFKSGSGTQFRTLRTKLKGFKWRVGMTGTPVAENFQGLYGQCLMLDMGARLGTRKDKFLQTYFYPTDYNQYNWALRGDGSDVVALITDLIHTVPDYRDTLPDIHFHTVTVDLPDVAREVYAELAKNSLIAVGGGEIAAENAAVLTGKLQQVASGFVYNEDKKAVRLHDAKLLKCRGLADQIASPVIICYWFKSERETLLAEFPEADCLGGGMSAVETKRVIERWNSGETPVLLVQPRSAGHGLQLEQGGADIIWHTPVWSRDLFEQTNARVWRTGQLREVNIWTIESADTVDSLVSARVDSKAEFAGMLAAHLAAIII